MSTLTDRTIDALRDSYVDLATRASAMGPADLDRTSGSAEWDVAQILSHLGSAAEIGLARLQSAIDGTESPVGEFNREVWARWDALGQQEKADGFVEWAGRLNDTYASFDEATRRDLRVRLDFLPQPVDLALLTGLQLNESLLHAWDVAVAFDPQATIPARRASVQLEHVRGDLAFLVGYTAKVAVLDGRQARLRVTPSPDDSPFDLVLAERGSLESVGGDADGELTIPTEAFTRLVSGRLSPDRTPEGVTLTSEVVSLDDLRAVFAGY